jgi:hypothetical protein
VAAVEEMEAEGDLAVSVAAVLVAAALPAAGNAWAAHVSY